MSRVRARFEWVVAGVAGSLCGWDEGLVCWYIGAYGWGPVNAVAMSR